jgi:hypothetical protein
MMKKMFSVLFLVSMAAHSGAFASAEPKKEHSEVKNQDVKEQVYSANQVDASKRDVKASEVVAAKEQVKSAPQASWGDTIASVKKYSSEKVTAAGALVLAIYQASWVNHKALTCSSLAALTGVLLYNYNDDFRVKIRGILGLDQKACALCPESCK